MDILAAINLGVWEWVCIIFTILLAIKIQSIVFAPVCGLVIYIIGRIIAFPIVFCKWVATAAISNPLPTSIIIGAIIIALTIRHFAQKRKERVGNTNTPESPTNKIIDAKFEDQKRPHH